MTTLPGGWVAATVGDLVEPLSGPAFKSSEFRRGGAGIRLLRGDNIEPGSLRWLNERLWPDHLLPGYEHMLLQADDIILAMDRPIISTGLKLAKVKECDVPALLVQRVARLRPIDPSAGAIVYYALLHDAFKSALQSTQTGTQLPHITLKQIASFEFPLPPLPEQARIVAAIEEAFSKLDAGEAALGTVRQRLKRMRDSVLAAAVTGRLVPQDPSDQPASNLLADLGVELLEHGSLSCLPDSWAWAALGAVTSIGGGIQKQPKRAAKVNPIPFLRVANVGRGSLDLADVHNIEVFEGELERYGLLDGDLLVVEGNGSPDQIGRAAMWNASIEPCVHQNHLIRVRPLQALIPAYLELYWNSPLASRRVQAVASSTSGLHTLSTGKLKVLPVALPPIEEQQRMVAEVDRQLSFIDAAERAVDAGLAMSAALRRSVLKAAFEGRLVPQDPSDEPASALLERIRADRSATAKPPAKRTKPA